MKDGRRWVNGLLVACVLLGWKVVEKVGAYCLYTYVPSHLLNIASDTQVKGSKCSYQAIACSKLLILCFALI